MFLLLAVRLNYLLLFFSCSFPLFCIIQHPLAAGHCQILPTLKEFFSVLFFFVGELFREELQLPVQAARRPSKERTSTPPPAVCWMASPLPSSCLGASGLSPPPVTHATAVNICMWVSADHRLCETHGAKL